MFLAVYASPAGMLVAIAYSDVKRRFRLLAVVVRTLSAFVLLSVCFLVLDQLGDISSFIKNDSWMLIPLLGPLLVGGATEFILGKSRSA